MRGRGGQAPPGTFETELTDALVGIQRLIRRRLRGGLAGPRLRGAEVELLRLVESRPGIGVSEAARELHLASNSVSTLVNQLVRDGYLVRETDPADRRAARLRLTGAAEKRLEDWHRRRADLVGRQLNRLDEADREALHAALPALRRLAGHLREEIEEPVSAPAGTTRAPEAPWTKGTPS
ncbi:MarR family transcriptional regulator [Streptomyces misionensis]|uniref:MarR family transcriptional regulator n=1 Tax=Streptomyces misionensis TaxID=67331 RepID=A0A5C6IZL3_9ACTN|nr:MarR family transcriptional regulator [Streptomyces misionensis]